MIPSILALSLLASNGCSNYGCLLFGLCEERSNIPESDSDIAKDTSDDGTLARGGVGDFSTSTGAYRFCGRAILLLWIAYFVRTRSTSGIVLLSGGRLAEAERALSWIRSEVQVLASGWGKEVML
jgi:hypothetical protein